MQKLLNLTTITVVSLSLVRVQVSMKAEGEMVTALCLLKPSWTNIYFNWTMIPTDVYNKINTISY